MAPESRVVRTGLDNLTAAIGGDHVEGIGDLAEIAARIRGGAVCGLISNPASINAALEDACTALIKSGVRLGALFGPEHGARGAAGAGEVVGSGQDPVTGLPVYSLYGATKRPSPDMLQGLDLVLFDLQDVGVRFYTFTWTLSYILEACAEAQIPVVVLDRPNPLGGLLVEGPLLEPGLESFVGRFRIPWVHGMTSAELARLFAGEFTPGAQVLTSGMSGWRRSIEWDETGLEWAGPSPNIPTAETAAIYPATCLFEGTNVSEGRGTPLPFRSVGAPWIDPWKLAAALNERTTSRWRGLYFVPSSSKHNGVTCGGVEWYPPQVAGWQNEFRPARLGLEIVAAIRQLWPDKFEWLVGPKGRSHFDLLTGRRDIRIRLDAGEDPADIAAGWPAEEEEFRVLRRKYLLYD